MRRPVPFGNYLLLDRIAVGGMAEVFAAKTFGVEGFERTVAIKRILPNMVEDDEFISSKYKTASAAAQSIFNKLNAMKGEVKGRLRIGAEKDVTIIRFNDSMLVDESEIALIKKELCDNLNKPNQRVLMDLKNVRRLSSSAVIMLADFYRWLNPWGSTLAFCRVRPELESAMSMLRIENVSIFKDKRTALTSKW